MDQRQHQDVLAKMAFVRSHLQGLSRSLPPADQDELIPELAAHLERSLDELRSAERLWSRLGRKAHRTLGEHLQQEEEHRTESRQVEEHQTEGRRAEVDKLVLQSTNALQTNPLPWTEKQSIELLAAGVAHIFNNLLTAVACDADVMLAELRGNHPLRENIKAIQSNVRRGGSLTRRLLAFGRRQLLEPQETQLNDLIRELEVPLRQLAGDAEVGLHIDLAKELGKVWIDPAHLEQIVIDLVVNACEAMPQGGSLRIETSAIESLRFGDGDEVEDAVALAVSDTGRGIRDVEVEQLFAPFYSTKEPYEGAGLSLAAARAIIEESGGFIEVDSSPGEGSTFRILLPRMRNTKPRVSSTPSAPKVSGEAAPWVMLVEDEGNVRRPLTRILENQGYRVLSAEDAEQATRLANAHPGQIDVLVTDLIMPGDNGLELAEKLAESRPQLKVLVTTGYPGALRGREVDGKTGEVRVLKKPFTGQELCVEISRLLARDQPSNPQSDNPPSNHQAGNG